MMMMRHLSAVQVLWMLDSKQQQQKQQRFPSMVVVAMVVVDRHGSNINNVPLSIVLYGVLRPMAISFDRHHHHHHHHHHQYPHSW
jgi:hypothetical protein